MLKTADLFDMIVRRASNIAVWLVLILVFLQFGVVVFRYVFGINSVDAQEMVTIVYGLIFMLAAAYVLQVDRHVRVDIFYGGFSDRGKKVINSLGTLFLLLPMAFVVWFYSWGYVAESWQIFEGSPDAGGLRVRFLQKTVLLIFALLMALQGISSLLRMLSGTAADSISHDQ